MLYFCGDLHGNLNGLNQSLEEVGFDKLTDHLICTGDLVDRGTQNEEIIDLLDEPWFDSVCGNHDQWCIDSFYSPNFDKYTHMKHGGMWFYSICPSAKQELVLSLEQLPYYMEIEYNNHKFGIVHAEVPFLFERWQHFIDHINNEVDWVAKTAIWGRNVIESPNQSYILSDIDFVIHGHTGVPEPVTYNNRVWLDTGYLANKISVVSADDIINNKLTRIEV